MQHNVGCRIAILKQNSFKFAPETVVSKILDAHVCWEAVQNTRPNNSEAPVDKCVVCVWNGTQCSTMDERS